VRVLLIQPPHRDTFGYSMPPLGPLHLAASARRHGHEPLFLDLALLLRRGDLPADADLIETCAERVVLARPDVVGLTSMVSSLPAALHLAACLRRRLPTVPLILGGQGPEQVEEAVIARHPAVDAVAVGEADETFPQWLDALAAGTDPVDVPGLVLRRDGRPFRTAARAPLADLDAVDPPAWDVAESPAAYRQAAGGDEALFPIDLGRGCTYSCAFCTTPVFWGRRARQLSPARAADEFDRLAALEGLDTVYVTHDLFTVDRENVLAICTEKRARGNALPWECRTRLDLVDEQLLVALRDAGCRRILYGVESDTPSVLELVDKGGRSAQLDVRGALAMAARAGMASIVGTMAGVPGETESDVEANLRLMAEVAVIDGVSLSMHWFNVLPGNGQAAAVQGELHLHPGVHADLVRGHDLPPGRVPAEQRALIAEDPEVFAAFRVFPQPHADETSLYLLTRNAHLLLEVLPRTVRALAHARGATLLGTLLTFLRGAWAGTEAPFATLLANERGEHGEPFVEARVLDRESGVRLLSHWASTAGDPAVDALRAYERALFETDATHLVRFDVDPLPLVRAMDAGDWPPEALPTRPGAVLFTRRGDAVRAHALSEPLAEAYEWQLDPEAHRARHPDGDEQTWARAWAVLEEHLRGS
jgi:radical SAM superfamily enzyme YgiQ (UPF0313 family)